MDLRIGHLSQARWLCEALYASLLSGGQQAKLAIPVGCSHSRLPLSSRLLSLQRLLISRQYTPLAICSSLACMLLSHDTSHSS